MNKHFSLHRLRLVVANESRLLLADRGFRVVGAVFLALILYALSNGMHQAAQRGAAQEAIVKDDAARRAQQYQRLEHILAGTATPGPFDNPADPTHMGGGYGAHHAVMPPAPLAPVALGQDDLFPTQYKVTYESRISFVGNNDIENPWHLLSGNFDLAFVVVYLLPFLVFALGYNLLSGERESGTLRLLLSQPLALATLVAGKVFTRAAVLLALAVLVPLAALLLARPETARGGMPAVLLWAAMVCAYALFWFALVLAVNALGRASSVNAMILVVAWVILVLVVPSVLNLAVSAAVPSPSRAELATRTRVVTAEAMARHNDLLSTDYEHVGKPEVLVPDGGKLRMAGRLRGMYRIEREVDDLMRPELDRFDVQQARRQELVNRFSVLSPAAVTFEGMSALAGTGQRRHAWFMRQVAAYHTAWKRFFFTRVDADRAISPADFRRIPAFAWQEEPAAVAQGQAGFAIFQLLVPTLALLLFSAWRLRRYAVV